jgi:DNA-binding PadR family transcriptional regulator
MAEYGTGEIKPHEAVLGLMACGRSSAGALKHRLEREFPQANYAPNTANTALRRLADKGHVRVLDPDGRASEDVYEITQQGLDVFESWLYDMVAIPAPLRDPLQAKLAFVRPDGVGGLISIIRVLEEAAAHQYGVEHGRLRTLHVARGITGKPDLELQSIRHKYTASLWGHEAKRLAKLRKDLEQLQANLSRLGDS